MNKHLDSYILVLKTTEFYKKNVKQLFVSDLDPDTIFYTSKKVHLASERDAAMSPLDYTGIVLMEMGEAEACDDTRTHAAICSLRSIP